MKHELTAVDMYYLVRELQVLEGAKINKIYEQVSDKKEFLFLFHKTGPGKMMLRIKLPEVAYLTDYKQIFPETPPGFCTFLRKYLTNSRVKEIRQKGFERILELVLDTKQGVRILICELFSKGNMVLLDEDYKIKGLLQSQNWQARTIRGGIKYEYPPEQLVTPMLTLEQFDKTIKESKKDSIVKTLAIDFGLSGVYAEEVCERAGIDKDLKKITKSQEKKLFEELNNLFLRKTNANRIGKEVFPFEMSIHEGKKEKEFLGTFNHLLDEVLTDKIVESAEEKVQKEKSTKEDKTKVIIKKQEERLKALEKGIEENQKKGEFIYEHYQEIDQLLKDINSDRKKMDWEGIKKKYKSHKLLKKIDEKKGEIIVEI